MNETSQKRIEWAKAVALAYASHPDVRAIIIGGSTARGTATELSDIDLGLFWTKVASERERSDLIGQIGGKLTRCVPNNLRYQEGNPRREGWIEIIDFRPSSSPDWMRLDLEHETLSGTDQVLTQVLDKMDISLEKQELLSVIQDGIVLYGHDIVGRWRAKSKSYPQELAYKMVAENILGIGNLLMAQVAFDETQDVFHLHEGYLDIGRRLVLSLMGLNRVWAFTDNTDFKGLKPFADRLTFKPPDFVHRLGQAFQTNPPSRIHGFVDLFEEVLELIETHLPAVATQNEREILRQI
jgi:predicted nucleotidyltransferase